MTRGPRVKILVLSERLAPVGGTEIYVARQLSALASRGHAIAAISAEEEAPPLAPTLRWRGSRALFSASLRPSTFARARAAARALTDELAREGYDAALVHKLDAAPTLAALAGALPLLRFVHTAWAHCPAGTRWLPASNRACDAGPGLACLATDRREGCLGLSRGTRGMKDALRRVADLSLQRRFLLGADVVVANSAYTAERVAAATHRRAYVTVIPPPVTALACRDRPPEPGRALFVGRLAPYKGADHAIRAVARTPSARLVLAGEGESRPELEALAASLGAAERIKFRGWLAPDALAEETAAASVILFTSLWPEPFGMAGVEALARGRPVIAYDTGGVQSWLSSDAGVLVPPGDEGALTAALATLLCDPAHAARLGETGRAAQDRFSMERFTLDTEQALALAAARFRGRPGARAR